MFLGQVDCFNFFGIKRELVNIVFLIGIWTEFERVINYIQSKIFRDSYRYSAQKAQ